MNRLVDLLLRSNIFVALCASSLVWQSALLLENKADYLFESLVVFCATGFIYNMHRFVKLGRPLTGETGSLNKVMAVIFLISLLPCLLYFNKWQIQLFSIGGVIAMAYSFRIIKMHKRWYNLRTLPFSKLFAIVFVWTLMTAIFPVPSGFLFGKAHLFIVLERIFFLIAITLPFDIRDMDMDRNDGIRTIPNSFGWIFTRRLSVVSALGMAIIVILAWWLNVHNTGQAIALLISASMTIVACSLVKPSSPERYFSLKMEGLSLLQSLLVAVVYLI